MCSFAIFSSRVLARMLCPTDTWCVAIAFILVCRCVVYSNATMHSDDINAETTLIEKFIYNVATIYNNFYRY